MDTSIINETTSKEPNINCTLAKSASHVLIKIVEQIVEDINYFPTMEDSNEFKLLVKLGEHNFHQHLCRNCDGCLDYELIADSFNKFFEIFRKQYEKNKALLTKLEKQYNINYRGVHDEIEFMLFITKKMKLIEKRLDKDEQLALIEIRDAIEIAHKQLSSWYLHARIAVYHDIIMQISSIAKNQKFNYKRTNTNGKKSAYLDQNIIAHYIEDEKFKKKVFNLKNNNMIFVYSSYIIEDAIKMQQLYMKEFLSGVRELTDNKTILRNGNDLLILHEDVQYAVDRVDLFREYTKAAEKELIYRFMMHNLDYPVFSKKGKYYTNINKDPIKFFTSLKTLQDNDIELKKSMGRILHFECNYLRMSFDENFSIPAKYESLDEKFNLIGDLTTLLNIFNYKTENLSDQRKVMSSLQDVEHIKYASAANYLVTEDGRLRDRAKFIYQVLNIETQVMSLKEFEQFSNEILKKTHISTTQQQ